jgi:hypothetical protein
VTDVGKISLGVEIDASDLSAKLGEAVRRAIGPALQEIQRELEKTQREYNQTAKASEKANAAQAAGAKAVADAVEQVGQEQQKTAAKTRAASGVTSRSINAITRAIEKQTAALAANTAARAANAAAPTGGAPGGGGGSPGGGGGGPPNNRHRGGFMQGGKGRFGFLTSPLGLNLGALAIGSLGPAASLITQMVGGVQQLAQAGLALPGIYGAAGASIGVAFAGFKGMGDAVKALNDAAKSGDPKDLEKATEAMKDMDPAAQAVAKSVSALTRGPLLDLRKQIQGHMFKDFAGDLDSTANKAIPRLTGGILGIADAWNGTLRQVTGSLGADKNLGLIDRVLGNTAEGQKRMNAAIDPLVHAALTLVGAGSDVLPRLADGLTKGATRLDNFLTKADQDGRLNKWINDGVTGVHQLADAALNLGKIITDITKAAGADQGGFLRWLDNATTKLHGLTSSASGQSAMRQFFRDANEMGKEWLPILENIGKALISVYEASRTWSNILLPFLRVASDLLTKFPGLITAAGIALLAWKTAGIFKPLINGLDGVIGRLDTVAVKAGKTGVSGKLGGVKNVLGALGSNRGTLGLAGLAAGTATQLTADNGTSQLLGALGTIGGGALTGAAIGSVVPGVGTAIGGLGGAAVGTVLAGVNALFGENSRAAKEAAAAQDLFAASTGRAKDASDLMAAAQKSLTDALYASKGALDPTSIQAIGESIDQIPEKLNAIPGVADALQQLNLTTEQMATIVSGAPADFDALIARLDAMGPAGQAAAAQLALIRDNTLYASQNASAAAPVLQTMADKLGISIPQAAANITNAFGAIPKNVPINVSTPGSEAVQQVLRDLGAQIEVNKDGTIHLAAPLSDQVLQALQALGAQIEQNRDGTIHVGIPQSEVENTLRQLGQLGDMYRQMFSGTPALPNIPVPPPPAAPGAGPFAGPYGADGMVVPGYAPGHDIVNAVLAPGEGVLIPEAVRGLGGASGVYGLNSMFRKNLSRRYYADGGVNPDGTPILPTGMPGPETELSVLQQIRDLLAGKGGTASNPLAATAANTATTATAAKTAGDAGTEIGPFGTPLKKKNRAYDAAKGALEALGFDAETIIGSDPMAAAAQTAAAGVGPGGVPLTTGTVDTSRYASALAKFATTGNMADLAGTGLDANDSVVKAIVAARNKKKGGLDDPAIAGLVTQTLGPGGFGGTLDATNTSLISALQTFKEKLAKGQGLTTSSTSRTTAASGLPMTPGLTSPVTADAMGLISFAQQASGGAYKWGASDLAAGLSDCSGAVSDLVELMTKGKTDPGRLFATNNAADVLTSLGAQPGLIPGTLQIGFNSGHMAATLPNGVNFESGGGTGQGATYGGNAIGANDPRFTQQFSLPVGPLPPGWQSMMPGTGGRMGGNPLGYSGSPVPVYIVGGPGGGMPGFAKDMLGAGIGAAGGAAANVSGDIISGLGAAIGTPEDQRAPNATVAQLANEHNPMALAAMLGFNVQDFTREGGAGPGGVQQGGGFDASGRLFSDTSGLIDRTFTSLNQQLQAMRDQIVDVIDQMSDKLNEDALSPVVKAGVQSALDTLKDSVTGSIGTSMGNAAGPPIADAVSSAVSSLPIDQSGAGSTGGDLAAGPAAALGGLFASGGAVYGGQPGKDSVPILAQQGEWVLNTADVAKMGGTHGVQRFVGALRSGGLKGYATGGGVNVNDVVGAEFFGVSEVPIISTIVNLLVRVLLKVIGVEIEARDTLNEMSNDFRSFRGDAFKAFDAQGRLLNDTSGLIERTSSSEETAAAERIRILKIVIEALIKYIIEKVIVPIAKAVANSAIQAGASAAGASIAGAGGGPAGGIVSSLISSAGQAGVDIAAEVGTDFALAMSSTLIDMVGEGLQSTFPDIMTGIFGGGALAGLFDPLGGGLSTVLGGLLGAITALFGGGLLGGAATMIPGDTLFGPLLGGSIFDDGGMASGVGYLPKATMDDELVLSPGETDLFSRFVRALENGGFGRGGDRTVHAPITVIGGRETAEQVQNRLLKLMP